ncbi:MAG: hypothetical protein EAZ95_10380 [Bacteroidetes bacterium]|nr:MAG: hypothetical protein EAZ95_10380 [Bacteroidota bacterium]
MRKYLIGASVPIILYVLYVFVSPFGFAYWYSLRERRYRVDNFDSEAAQPPFSCEKVSMYSGNKKSIYVLYNPNEWMKLINTNESVSKKADPVEIKEAIHSKEPWGFFLETKVAKKMHIRVWNKRSDAEDLLCETVSELTIGSFAMGKDTFWIPIIQRTQAKILEGVTPWARSFSVENVLKFYTNIQDDGSLETNLSLIQNFSAMKNYRFNARFEDGSFSSISTADISYTLMSFKIVSKNNKYEIVQGMLNQERLKKNKYFFDEKDAKRIGLEALGLDMFEVGTIEIEVVK